MTGKPGRADGHESQGILGLSWGGLGCQSARLAAFQGPAGVSGVMTVRWVVYFLSLTGDGSAESAPACAVHWPVEAAPSEVPLSWLAAHGWGG